MSAADLIIGLDVGGTTVKCALVDAAGRLAGPLHTVDAQSDRPRDQLLDRFSQILAALRAEAGSRPLAGIGVGMPGPFDYARGISLITGLGKYDAIYGVDLQADWRERLRLPADLPIRFVNDAGAFALGVSRFGAGSGLARVMAITLGTGCGAAFVVNDRLVTGGEGVPRGGEVYHLPLRDAIVDDWISRRGILRLWAEIAPDPDRTPGLDVRDLADAARGGDPAARRLFDRFGALLAEAIGPVAEAFRPDGLIAGGQIARSLDLFDRPLRQRLAALGTALSASTDPAAGVRGAASLIAETIPRTA